MKYLKSSLSVTVIVLVLALVLWTGNETNHALVRAQEADKVLEIERYPDEPLEIVDINVGIRSVKDRIKIKTRNPINRWGRDTVEFKEKNGWFKNIQIRLRNISGRRITGFAAAVHFESSKPEMLFRMLLARTRDLERQPLQPGEEIEVQTDQGVLNRTRARAQRFGLDLDSLPLSFSIDSAIFSETLMWYRGTLLKPDSSDGNRWTAEPEALGRNRPGRQPQFQRISFKPAPNRPVGDDCQQAAGGFLSQQCPDDIAGCVRIHEIGNGSPGFLSLHSSIGDCEKAGVACNMENLHDRFVEDPDCEPCPDADNDGFQSAFCGGADCDDTIAAVKPGATEVCGDPYDNDCDGCTCTMSWEGPNWEQSMDCSPCNDAQDNDCDGDTDHSDSGCWQCQGTPVLVDVSGNGFNLTNAANGVNFDLDSDGRPERLAWTSSQTDDAWLALDRNGDRAINNGTELFGNFTRQPEPTFGTGRNGFNALADYDRSSQGGNSDGLISERDAIFRKLLLWQDRNHNGVSEANELHTLQQLGLAAIECDYKDSKRQDQFGNQFRYRAKVRDLRNTQISRWAWDVILVREPNPVVNQVMKQFDTKRTGPIAGWLRN